MLLVGGDSFAEFPKETIPNGDVTNSVKEWKGGFLHWAEIISNGNAISTGAGGFDLGYTSLTAMEELYQNNYTHCIFFITDFIRISTQIVDSNMAILNKAFISQDTPQEFYGAEERMRPPVDPSGRYLTSPPLDASGVRRTVELNKAYHEQARSQYEQSIFRGHDSKHVTIPPGNEHGNTPYDAVENLVVFSSSGMTPLADNPEIHNYLKVQPGFEYMHTRLGYISLLKNYCNNNNIKILFACPFMEPEQVDNMKQFLQIDVFDIYQTITKKTLFQSAEFRECISHFNEEQHKMLVQCFNKDYPGWI